MIKNSYLFYNSSGGRRKRTRFIVTALSITVVTAFLFFVVPAPLKTQVEGVVSVPEYSRVRTGTDCFITKVLAQNDTIVQNGDPLLRCEDPFLEAEVQVLQANLEESKVRYNAEPLQSRVQREILREEIHSVKADLARALERKQNLTILSPNQGLFILPNSHNLPGHFAEKGTLLGYILGAAESTVVVVVSQSNMLW